MKRLKVFLMALFCVSVMIFVGASTAQAATPPSLQNELLGAQCTAFPPPVGPAGPCFSAGQGSVTLTCTPQSNGTEVLSFSVTNGVANGPYPGIFSESGSYTLGPAGSGGVGGGFGESMIGFSATFTIQSAVGTVTGTKTGTAAQQPAGNFNFCLGVAGQLSNAAAAFGSYTATITTAQGSFRDTGQTLAQVNGTPDTTPNGFYETFGSSNGVVPLCNQNSQVNQGQNGNNQGCVNP